MSTVPIQEKNIYKHVISKCFNFIFIFNSLPVTKFMIIINNIIHSLHLGSVCVILYSLVHRTITRENLLPICLIHI